MSSTTTVEPSPTRSCGILRHVDHGKIAQPRCQLAEPRLDVALALFRGVVFGVFAQIAMGAGLQDLPRKLDAQLHFEERDLLL